MFFEMLWRVNLFQVVQYMTRCQCAGGQACLACIIGRFQMFKDLITKAIDLNPDMPALYMNLASFSKIEIGSPHFEKIQEFLANKDIGPLKHTGLHFALSSSYEAAKDYDKAFEMLWRVHIM